MSRYQIREQGAHKLRTRGLRERCIVCGAEPYTRCIEAVREDLARLDKDQKAWAEFQLFSAVHTLKEVDPDHYLVRVIESALVTPVNPDQLELFPPGHEGA